MTVKKKYRLAVLIGLLAGLCAGIYLFFSGTGLYEAVGTGIVAGTAAGLLSGYFLSLLVISLGSVIYTIVFGLVVGVFYNVIAEAGNGSLGVTGFLVFMALLVALCLIQIVFFRKILILRDQKEAALSLTEGAVPKLLGHEKE